MVKLQRSRSRRIAAADQELLERIRLLKASHPFWGYRRVWAYLKFVKGLVINKKRVYRLLKENNLLVTAQTRQLVKRKSSASKPHPEKVNQWWGIDMTKVMTNTGWAYIVLVVETVKFFRTRNSLCSFCF